MSISDKIQALEASRQAIATAIEQKGGTVAQGDGFSQFATEISNLPSGGSGNPLLTSIDVSDFTGTTFNAVSNYVTDVTIPSGVTSIAGNAFQYATRLTSIEFPSSLTRIESRAFQGAGISTTITIPSNVTLVNSYAFADIQNIPSAILEPTTPPLLGNYAFFGSYPIYVPAASVDTYKADTNWSSLASRIYPIQQVATVDGNPVYNYDLGMTSTDTITSENMAKMPAGTNLELAEGITWAGGATAFSNYTNLTLPSTFTTFGDQYMLDGLTTVTSKATTPPSAERNQIGGSSLTAIYVPAASVDTYKAAGGWSNYASRIQAIPSPSITITEYEGQEVIDNAVDFGDFPGCVDDTVAPDEFEAASANSTFDSDLKAANIIVVEDDNGNDITSQCTFTSPDFARWDSTQDPSWDGESPVDYYWRAYDTITSGDSQTPGSVSITATYGALTDTVYLGYSKTDIGCGDEPEPEPDPEEEPEE